MWISNGPIPKKGPIGKTWKTGSGLGMLSGLMIDDLSGGRAGSPGRGQHDEF